MGIGRRGVDGMVQQDRPHGKHHRRGPLTTPTDAVRRTFDDGRLEAPERVVTSRCRQRDSQARPGAEEVGHRIQRHTAADPLPRAQKVVVVQGVRVVHPQVIGPLRVLDPVGRAVPTALHPLFQTVGTYLGECHLDRGVLGARQQPEIQVARTGDHQRIGQGLALVDAAVLVAEPRPVDRHLRLREAIEIVQDLTRVRMFSGRRVVEVLVDAGELRSGADESPVGVEPPPLRTDSWRWELLYVDLETVPCPTGGRGTRSALEQQADGRLCEVLGERRLDVVVVGEAVWFQFARDAEHLFELGRGEHPDELGQLRDPVSDVERQELVPTHDHHGAVAVRVVTVEQVAPQ